MISLKQLDLNASPFKEFKKFFSPLPVLLEFVLRFLFAAIPIVIYLRFPAIFGPYTYFSTTFFAWVFAGFGFVIITMCIYPAKDKFRKNNDLALPFHNVFLVLFWIISFFFFFNHR